MTGASCGQDELRSPTGPRVEVGGKATEGMAPHQRGDLEHQPRMLMAENQESRAGPGEVKAEPLKQLLHACGW